MLIITPIQAGVVETPSPEGLHLCGYERALLRKARLIITSAAVRKALGGRPSKYAKQLTARFIDGLKRLCFGTPERIRRIRTDAGGILREIQTGESFYDSPRKT